MATLSYDKMLEPPQVEAKELGSLKEDASSPLDSITATDLEALGAPHGISGNDVSIMLEATCKGIYLKDICDSLGIAPTVAAGISVDPSIVRLVQQEVNFRVSQRASINNLLDDLELSAAARLKLAVPHMTPMELLATVTKIAAVKRTSTAPMARQVHNSFGEVEDAELVELTVLPPTVPKFEMDELNRITKVGGTTMDTLSNTALRELAQEQSEQSEVLELTANKEGTYEDAGSSSKSSSVQSGSQQELSNS